jgi:crotonobetainyl-CoA:carnitine CoA-transferase CaiB-like acyl-CoA transferase
MSEAMALADLRVLDISTFVSAPFAAACLAEFGAEVLKIEKPGEGDSLRQLGTRSETGDSYFWLSEARNKKCITLDLRKPRGADLFRRMVKKADVVIENFRPGTLEKWGLGFADLLALNPGLVMLRISAYGDKGPKSQLPGFARIAQAYAGLTYLVGQPDTPPLIAGSTTLADYISGLYGAYGVLIALRVRERTGRGQYIDIGLHDGIFRFLDEIACVYDKSGTVRERMGTETPSSTPHSHYPTKDGKWVAIACTNDKMFERLASVMEQPDLALPDQYGPKPRRLQARARINQLVSDWTSTFARDEVIRRCSEGDVPCGPVNSIAEIFSEEQFWVRDTLIRIRDDRIGDLAVPGVVPRLSETPGKIHHLGRAVGANNAEIFREWLEIEETELDALRSEGVV